MVPWGTRIETGYSQEAQLFDMRVGGESVNVAAENAAVLNEMRALLQAVKNGEK